MDDRREGWKTFSRIGGGYAIFLLVTFALQVQMSILTAVLFRFGIDISFKDWYVPASSLAVYCLGGGLTYLVVRDMPVFKEPQEEKAGAKMLTAGFFVCISALFFGNLISLGLMSMVSAITGKPMINPLSAVLENLSGWSIIATMVVMAPVFEEILYRKVLIGRIRQYGDKAAILVSSFIFGLSHGNFYQFFYAFGIGLVFGYIYIRTGKLRYTILFHMVINFMGSFVALHAVGSLWISAIYSLFILGGAAVGLVVFLTSRKKLHFEPGIKEIWGRGGFRVMFLNLGMAIFFLTAAAAFLISEIS
ncbi:MAG: CPBP family glutamic-type intramembrane protease [Lacrimispora sp.]|uniref:CPBP family glutamic-type intramembrane protease n=1 Tax=Lacrimispora sp. TaxID=2719234 RepID=UPI0039E6F625